MSTFIVAHGAWGSGWAWKKMRPLMHKAGHTLFTPSYTGLGERAHLARSGIDLDTHINDVLNVLHYEDLSEVILPGHSYGGMVATGLADRAPERMALVLESVLQTSS
jgi:pimeloyl-ACP methyl ester carboxylesterase